MRTFLFTLVAFLIPFGSDNLLFAGDLTGKVSIQLQKPDPASPISPFARSKGARLANTGNFGNIVIYFEDHPSLDTGNLPTFNPVMDQRNLTIVPHMIPVVRGTTVDFPNSDGLYHNLFSLSPAKKFDLGRYAMGKSKSVKFEKVGEVHIFCDIHPSMSGVILVLPNRFYTTPASDGTFRISGIPAGTYSVVGWHEQLNEITARVTIPGEGDTTIDFDFTE